jgi:hypothetical protein
MVSTGNAATFELAAMVIIVVLGPIVLFVIGWAAHWAQRIGHQDGRTAPISEVDLTTIRFWYRFQSLR